MRGLFVAMLMLIIHSMNAQEESEIREQQIENETASNEFAEAEVEDERSDLSWFKQHRVNINTVTAEFLVNNFEVPLNAAVQLLQYRKLLGDLIDVHELQAVPGWDKELISRLIPYIKIGGEENHFTKLRSDFNKGNSYIQMRFGSVIEKSKGYWKNDDGKTAYAGSPLKLMIRYRFSAGRNLQWGYTTEKDAGEKVFSSSKPFLNDYHSFYFSMEGSGRMESFVAGDFEINMGQGLIHWQSAAYKKSASTVNPLRQGYFAVPHKGLNEQLFHRGVAAAFRIKKFFFGFFAACNHWDANKVTDSLNNQVTISSVQLSGLHRTANEIADKNALRVLTFGSTLRYQLNTFKMGINIIKYQFDFPIGKRNEPANRYAIAGNHWLNFSIDYRYTFKNYFLFGEVAGSQKSNPAFLAGVMAVLHPKVDISLVWRRLPPNFKSLNGNAFTEQSEPGNENGMYFGIAVKFSSKVNLNAYADVFSIPMIRSRTPSPIRGNGHLMQLTYRPDKKNSLFVRLAVENKEGLDNLSLQTIPPVALQKKSQLRIHQQLTILPGLTMNNRVDWVWIAEENRPVDRGFQVFTDLFWKPAFSALGLGLRISRFETDSYNSRIYSFEKDVRNLQAVNLSAGKGWRNYFLIHYKYKSCIHISFKFMRSYYLDNQLIGSGNEEINRPSKSEYRLQIFFFF